MNLVSLQQFITSHKLDILFGGIDNVETLGNVAQFCVNKLGQTIMNPFFGIKDSIGLKIALDLMA